jgi:hypothetical protein
MRDAVVDPGRDAHLQLALRREGVGAALAAERRSRHDHNCDREVGSGDPCQCPQYFHRPLGRHVDTN